MLPRHERRSERAEGVRVGHAADTRRPRRQEGGTEGREVEAAAQVRLQQDHGGRKGEIYKTRNVIFLTLSSPSQEQEALILSAKCKQREFRPFTNGTAKHRLWQHNKGRPKLTGAFGYGSNEANSSEDSPLATESPPFPSTTTSSPRPSTSTTTRVTTTTPSTTAASTTTTLRHVDIKL